MSAVSFSPATSSVFPPQAAGTHYPADLGDLSELLTRALVNARSTSIESAKMVVTPVTLNEISGAVMASALANLANRRGIIKKVVVLGPARRAVVRGLIIPSHDAFSTPMGELKLDGWNLRTLRAIPQVQVDDRGFELESAVEAVLPLLQACLGAFELTPVLVGNVQPEIVNTVLRKVWGGPETLIVLTSDLSSHLDAERARAYDVETRGIVETLGHDALTTTRADGHRIIAGALMRAADMDLRITGLDFRTAPGLTGKAVGYGAFAFEAAQNAQLNAAERRYLLRLAANTIVAVAENPVSPARPLSTQRTPMTLSAIRAATVTIERDGVLRGMAGGLRPYRTLVADVIARASEAASGDVRLAPVLLDELQHLTLTISITSTPRPVLAHSEIGAIADMMPGRDGIVVEQRGRSARALPSEWERIPHPALFLRTLRQRAGIDTKVWAPDMTIKRFTAETFSAPLSTLID